VQECNEAAAEELVAKLDALVPREGARVALSQYGGGPDECRVVANRRGYLRLGIEFLRAAFAPHEKQHVIKADIHYLLTEDSDIGFDWFERREDLPPAAPESRPGRIVGPIIGFGFLGLIILCALVGLVTIIRWFL